MKNLVSRFLKDESGATAIEYALNRGDDRDGDTAVQGVGTKLTGTFTTISTSLK